jgi:hypothetical protein
MFELAFRVASTVLVLMQSIDVNKRVSKPRRAITHYERDALLNVYVCRDTGRGLELSFTTGSSPISV